MPGENRRRVSPRLARLTLARRLTLALAAMAIATTTLAVSVQDRALSRDLRLAAEQRLARAASAADQLVENHLAALVARYRTVSGTPQLRAALELADAPTLGFFAAELRERERAELVALVDSAGAALARSGPEDLAGLALAAEAPRLVPLADRLHAVVRVPLATGGRQLGSLVAAEVIGKGTLAAWSSLCGAEVTLDPAGAEPGELLVAPVRTLGEHTLSVHSSLDAERTALANARARLALAGSAALAIALLACTALARSLVRPILAIQAVVDRVRSGDLRVRIRSGRGDEIGDVARGIDLMLENLNVSRAELDERLAELHESQLHLAKAQQLARVGSFDLDRQTLAIRGSAEFWAILGIQESAKPGPEALMERIHPDERSAVVEAFESCLRDGSPAQLDHRIVLPDGSERVLHSHVQRRPTADGSFRLEGTIQDITERRRADEQIRYLAYRDSLTGLGNRRLFGERMELAIAQARRRNGRLGVLFLDLDHFKRINDTLGHSVGDELLRQVADRLVRTLRESDLVSRLGDDESESTVSRLGGDEFTLLLAELRDPRDLAAVASRLLAALRQPFEVRNHELVIGASIGIASWPADGETLDALLSNADSAMYHAKANGRNGYQFYDQSMNAAALRRLTIEARLRRALEHDELALHYQPRIELASGRITGFEALLRWTDAELGAVPPGEFIPISEQTGLIETLGEWVMRTVCHEICRWERVVGPLGLRVSLNVSARQFGPELSRKVARILAETGVNPVRVELEITESAILRDEAGVIQTLHELRGMGLAIALDDFGTGYSSLSHLRRLPVDTLKIDQSFVKPIAQSGEAAALTRSIVAMGKALGLRVVAEGVETDRQRALLAEWSCDEIQGFVICRAEPADQALARLRADRERAA